MDFLSGTWAEIRQDPDTTKQTLHLFWDHIWVPDHFFSHLIYKKRTVKLDWDTSDRKLLRTLRSHWLTLQGLSELSAHWVCSVEPSPKCSFSPGSWCVHTGVNKRYLLVQWRYKFACKVTQATSPMFTFCFKVNQKTFLTSLYQNWTHQQWLSLKYEILSDALPRAAVEYTERQLIKAKFPPVGTKRGIRLKFKLENWVYCLPYASHHNYQTLYIPSL